jgi:hypothetical protein
MASQSAPKHPSNIIAAVSAKQRALSLGGVGSWWEWRPLRYLQSSARGGSRNKSSSGASSLGAIAVKLRAIHLDLGFVITR